MYGDVRLAGGDTAHEGRVEVCINNTWISICNGDNSEWDENEATVICRQITGEHNPSMFVNTLNLHIAREGGGGCIVLGS